MLTNTLKALVYKVFLETFYGKIIKKLVFLKLFIFHIKVMSKLSLNSLLTIVLRVSVNLTHL